MPSTSRMFGAWPRRRHDVHMSRRDYWHDPSGPRPTSLVVAVSAVVQNDFGDVLMIERTDSGLWSIPGGAVEPGETLNAAVVREVNEETGYRVSVDHIVGVFSDPAHVIRYDDGETRQEFSICFQGSVSSGAARTSDESRRVEWLPCDELDSYKIHPSIRLRIDVALSNERPYFT